MREVVETVDELDAAVEDYEEMGWEVDERTSGRVVFRWGLRGNFFWHLLYFIPAPVFGNLAYSAFRRFNRPRYTVVRVRGGVAEEVEQVGVTESVDNEQRQPSD
jgi:hypothetical protein